MRTRLTDGRSSGRTTAASSARTEGRRPSGSAWPPGAPDDLGSLDDQLTSATDLPSRGDGQAGGRPERACGCREPRTVRILDYGTEQDLAESGRTGSSSE